MAATRTPRSSEGPQDPADHRGRLAATSWGEPIKVVYGPEDLAGIDQSNDIGVPGEYPYTRGPYPTMYRGRHWTIREYGGFGTPEETNERFRYLLDHGETGLSVAFDLPTQLGSDSDDPEALDDVGRVGVAVDTLRDMEVIYEGIALERVSSSFTINATAAIILAMYICVGERQGVPSDRLTGTLQNDILKEYAARGTYIFPPEPSLRLTVDVIQYCTESLPRFYPISVCGAHYHEAGATPPQEMAFSLGAGITYVSEVLRRGIDIDRFAKRLSFNSQVLMNFFEEIAKFRAGRRIWARTMRHRFGAKEPASWQMRMFTGSGGVSLVAQEPMNNIIRVTTEALAAALGGVQALHTCSWDEAFAIPTPESVLLAVRTQQIIANETGVTDTVDPLGGSYYVEALTASIEREILRLMDRIAALGGMASAIESGYVQREIGRSAYEYERSIRSGDRKILGVNLHPAPAEEVKALHASDRDAAGRKANELRTVRAERSADEVARSLRHLDEACRGSENVMPALIESVRAYATVGEMTDVMRRVFGEHRQPSA